MCRSAFRNRYKTTSHFCQCILINACVIKANVTVLEYEFYTVELLMVMACSSDTEGAGSVPNSLEFIGPKSHFT